MSYQALQCFSCHVVQVKEVRKSSSSNSKWSCVLCSEKQSVRKVYCKADTAKEVRNFVQKFNLARGQALEAEGTARLEDNSPAEDWVADHSYQEDEEHEQVKQRFGRSDYHTGQKKSFKWDKFLPAEEELTCSGDQIQQSSDDMKLTTTFPEPSSRRRKRPYSSSSPPPKRPERDSATPRDDAKHKSSMSSDSTKPATYASRPDNSLKCQQGSDYGFEDRATLGNASWKCSTAPESKPSSSPASVSDCSLKNVKSCHAQESKGQTSKYILLEIRNNLLLAIRNYKIHINDKMGHSSQPLLSTVLCYSKCQLFD